MMSIKLTAASVCMNGIGLNASIETAEPGQSLKSITMHRLLETILYVTLATLSVEAIDPAYAKNITVFHGRHSCKHMQMNK